MKTALKAWLIAMSLPIVCPVTTVAQDIHFSQFYDLPILRNPAIAGLFDGDLRITTGFRNQWQSVTVPYQTIALGLEIKKPVSSYSEDFITFGVQLTNDQAGDSKLTRSQIFPVLNYHKSINPDRNLYISAGFMAGPVMQRFDPTQLQFDDQYHGGVFNATNPTQQVINNNRTTYWDPATGISLCGETENGSRYYAGLGLFHFTRPKVNFMKDQAFQLMPKYVLNGGFTMPAGDLDQLTFYADLFKEGGAEMVQGGMLWSHALSTYEDDRIRISGGLFFRAKDAVIPVVKLEYQRFNLGMTYDVNTSKLNTASNYRGGFELTLSYQTFSSSIGLGLGASETSKIRCVKF
jgi:type IX secretion system PorP/SprF family membrane protein